MSTPQPAVIPRRRPRSAIAGSDTNPLLDLACGAPMPGSGLVRRPTLVQSLIDARGAALALIVAPPGYGKSTLLAEWAECDPRPFVWLALGHGEPGTISALTALPPWGPSDGLAELVRATRRQHAGFVVVLDDAHLAPAAVLRDVVEAAVQELPAGSAIALASRSEPALALSRLRTHRLLCEVRLQQLAMSPAEAATLLREQGLEPAFEEVQTLVRRTEGWAAALYLASLAVREDPESLAGFGGRHHLLTDYLRDEVLAALPPEAISFSIRTSVLDELSGPICNAVLTRRGSAQVLEQLARLNPLLVPVDPAHHGYRWHTLMRETLEGELRRLEPELEPALRLRASSWFSGRGDTRRAIDHAARSRDAELTGDLLWHNILRYVTRGHSDVVRGWLRNFCSERIGGCASLALSASLSALMAGDMDDARHWSLAAAAALERGDARPGLASLSTGLAVVEAISAHDGVARMCDVATRAAETEPEDSLWRPLCFLLSGVATHLQGDRGGAERLLDESIRFSGHDAPRVSSLSLAQRAMIAIEREDWGLAAELTDRATIVVDESSLTTDRLSALVLAAAAASRAHEGRIDEAKRDLRSGVDLLAALGEFVPWYAAEARILLAYASLWLADIVGARTLLAEASRCARRTPGAAIFPDWFDHAWAYMDTMAETSLTGPSSLTIAELRILRFLPSHHSFREIAAQLGVSANTVKTQAHAVYRKLGAASRSEAVAKAIETGLIGQ